jgi:hypothetical protein
VIFIPDELLVTFVGPKMAANKERGNQPRIGLVLAKGLPRAVGKTRLQRPPPHLQQIDFYVDEYPKK